MALRIGITTGDPAGVGPEIALRALDEYRENGVACVLIGRREVYEAHHPGALRGYASDGRKVFHNVPAPYPIPEPGKGTVDTGAESKAYIDEAISLWRAGEIDAMVTGPVNKSLIERTGIHFTGHTEYIAEAIGEKDPLMLMFSPQFRVLLVTTHVPLERVAQSITGERILQVIMKGHEAARFFDGGEVRIAVAGLDPHCGDEGAIGTFDRDVTAGAIARAREQGIRVEGPFAADTLFMPGRWERYNLVIAQYHDQGLIPFKVLAFDRGVNATIGLSIVRTSVDHGTAFDIAGKGIAQHTSMIEAISLARRLIRR